MPEPTNNGNGNGGEPNGDPQNINNNDPANKDPQNPTGSQPGQNGEPSGKGDDGKGGDVQLTDEQLAAAFNHPRFKALNDKAKKADELEKQQQKAAEEAAKKNGEFEKLYTEANTRAEQAEQALQQERINNAAIAEASKLGVVDAQAAIKLLDKSNVTVSDDGTISGVEEAVKDLASKSPYLFKTPNQQPVGSGSNPDGNNNSTEFTYSQIQDLSFYKENQPAIDKAIAEGRIDMTK